MKIISKIVCSSLLFLMTQPLVAQASYNHVFKPPGFLAPDCNIPTEQPYASKFVDVFGHSMRYVETGDADGEVFLFVHGTPTYSYIWRNVMHHLVDHVPNARVISVDSIGMGLSERPPNLAYTIQDHLDYFEGFVEALGLKNITFITHDQGSLLAMTYADRHPGNVRAMAFMEALLPPNTPFVTENMSQIFQDFMALVRTPGLGEQIVIENNAFLGDAIPDNIYCVTLTGELDPVIWDAYRAPWVDPPSRRVLLNLPRTLPWNGDPADALAIIESQMDWLIASEIPKLLIHMNPGVLMKVGEVKSLENDLKNLSSVSVGPGIHFIQETNPKAVGRTLAKWALDEVGRSCDSGNNTSGTQADDSVVAQSYKFFAGKGDDQVSAAACNTRIVFGGKGNDTLTAGYGSIIKGQSGNDFLDGTFSRFSNLHGGSGSDTLWLGDKTFARGGRDADTFLFFGSRSKATGGKGNDRFIIAVDGNLPATNGPNTIVDFRSGHDSIVFTGFGDTLTSIDDLRLTLSPRALTISVADKEIARLKGVYDLTADDVVFE